MRNSEINRFTSSIDLVIEFNNEGANCSANGFYEDAQTIFKGAIYVMFDHVHESMKGKKLSALHLEEDIHYHKLHQRRFIEFAKETAIKHRGKAVGNNKEMNNLSTGNSSFIYNRPIKIDKRRPNNFTNEDIRLFYSAILLYNKALAQHVSSSSSSSRKRAMERYEASYDLFLRLYVDTSHEDPVLLHLGMAILNNMAEICYEFGEYKDAEENMIDLSKLVLLQRGLDTCVDDEEIILPFLLNISFYREPTLAAAA